MSRSISFALAITFITLTTIYALPAGFMTFFETGSCPPGWSEYNTAQGRLIVSVADPSISGVTVNQPLKDQEDRAHMHTYSAVANFPEKEIAAIDCCNRQGAHNGQYPVGGNFGESTTGYPFTQLLLCQLNQDSQDVAPFGTIAYFNPQLGSCPQQWAPYTDSQGRFLVPSFNTSAAVTSRATPLQNGQDLVHNHPYLTSFDPVAVEYAGAEGCCNHHPAAADTVYIYGNSSTDSTGLPYIQLLTCICENFTFETSFPPGTLVFNSLTCPQDWILSVELSGRLLVALPDGGTPGAQFGGPALYANATDNPVHTHSFSGSFDTSDCGVGLASGCCAHGYAAHQTYSYSGNGNATEIDLPYIMLPLCRKLDKKVEPIAIN